MRKTIIDINKLTKSFQGHKVLSEVSLRVEEGEFLTILGPSGCGKTTLLRLISGFETPDSGDIQLDGRSVKHAEPNARDVNTVFQSYALFPHMSVFDNVAFGLRCKKINKPDVISRVNDVLEMVKLADKANMKPDQLSGGQQQRVAIARAVVNKPLVLLLDEPLSALDYALRKNMQLELKTLQRKLGITFVLVTHDQEEALSMSDRVVVMNEGCIEQIGTPRNIYEKPASLSVAKFIGAANIFDAQILNAFDESIVVEIEGKSFTLENDCFSKKGDAVHLLIRPEDLRAWDKTELEDKNLDQMIEAKVEQVIYKGSTVDLILKTDGGKQLQVTEFFDEDDEDLDYKTGERVWVEWMIGWEVVIPNKSNRNENKSI
jgi:spermidine/putrescine transport system ATP-binding protein